MLGRHGFGGYLSVADAKRPNTKANGRFTTLLIKQIVEKKAADTRLSLRDVVTTSCKLEATDQRGRSSQILESWARLPAHHSLRSIEKRSVLTSGRCRQTVLNGVFDRRS